jgi:hypothetical protein
MSGKYSAEWWQKFSNMNQEGRPGRDPSNVIDDLPRETARGAGRPPIGVKAETVEAHAAVPIPGER